MGKKREEREVRATKFKGVIDNLPHLVISLVVVVMVLGMGFVAIGQYRTNLQTINQTQAATEVERLMPALRTISDWIPLIVVIIIIAIIIGLLFRILGEGKGR